VLISTKVSKCWQVRGQMDQAYTDKLDGKIPMDFWQRKMNEWQQEQRQIESAMAVLKEEAASDRLLTTKRILELANRAYFLYVTRKPAEQAELLRKVLLNCSIDSVSVYPAHRKPFDLIFERAKREEWSALADDFRTALLERQDFELAISTA
jgi:hypothetical protein